VVVIPWYLIPGRPYPLQVYQFACSCYSSNPEIGQRGAAQAARAKFNLKTFSHSTVSRSFRSFEQAWKVALENRFGQEVRISDAEGLTIVSAAPKSVVKDDEEACSEADVEVHSERRFPSVADTARRREVMFGFLPKFANSVKTVDIEAVGRLFAKDWHKNYLRLLL
jgi:hypothetical protein